LGIGDVAVPERRFAAARYATEQPAAARAARRDARLDRTALWNPAAGAAAYNAPAEPLFAPEPLPVAYTLPEEIDPNAVRANFRNGMLELHLPKAQPQTSQSVSVPITAGEEGAQNPPAVSSPPTQPGTTPQKPG
jgi:hypothetical protein